MGEPKNEIVGEGTTNDAGRAVIRFAPAQTGQIEGTLAFWGSHGYAPSETTVSFDVQQAGLRLHPGARRPAGLVGPELPDPRPVRRDLDDLPVAPLARDAGQEGGRSGVSAIRYRRNELKEGTMKRTTLLLKVAAAVAALTLVLVACSSNDSSTTTDSTTTEAPTSATEAPTSVAAEGTPVAVAVGETDVQNMYMTVDPDTIPAGTVTFTVVNEGVKKHEFVILSTDVMAADLPLKGDEVVEDDYNAIDEIGELPPGETHTLTVDLEPGHYALICNLKGHVRMGMYADITVE